MEENRNHSMSDLRQKATRREEDGTIIVPVIREHLVVDKEVIETKVRVRKTVKEEETTLNIPLIQENYEVERVPVNEVLDEAPKIRYEGETIVVPVMKEIVVVQKRYEVVEELRLTKRTSSIPHIQEITLLSEEVHVERSGPDDK